MGGAQILKLREILSVCIGRICERLLVTNLEIPRPVDCNFQNQDGEEYKRDLKCVNQLSPDVSW